MAQVKILKRSQNAVQCSSCKQRYDTIDLLDQHLETSSTRRRICPRTKAPALIVCIDCERDFASVQELGHHVQNSFLHNPELSQPTGRSVYVGRLPANIREQDIVNVLFKDFIVETTSMRTHCPHWDNFTFVTLTTTAEADRAVKKLHNKRLFNQKIIVSLQRSNEGSATQLTGRKARSRIISMAPSSSLSTKSSAMKSGAENIGVQTPRGRPVYVQPNPSPFGPQRPTFSYAQNPPLVYTQQHPPLPFHPPPPINYGRFDPHAQVFPAPGSHNFAYQFPPAFVPGGTLPVIQHPPPTTSKQRPRRDHAKRKQAPPQHDGPSDTPAAASLFTSTKSRVDVGHDSAVHMSTPSSASAPSTSSNSDPQYCIDKTWPPLVSSDTVPEARAWISFRDDEIDDAYQTLERHCHDAATLISAQFNIRKPTMPPLADLRAKVKCRSCRFSRHHLDRLIASTGVMGCPVARNGMHSFGGVSHLTARYKDFEHSPAIPQSSLTTKRRAIALDCEMAGGRSGDGLIDQLIQLTAIDYLTGEILISALVKPTLEIQQWRTKVHGVTHGMILQAARDGTALRDLAHAREVLFSFMDKSTILVGHALHHDLNVLKIIHGRCVDSEVLAKAAIDRSGQGSGTSLKKLCDGLMGLGVQRMVNHSCLEDSFAAREAVIYMISHPEELAVWAKAKQEIIDEEVAKRVAAKQAKEEAKEQVAVNEAKERTAASDDKQLQPVLAMAMPVLIPTPASEIPDELQMNRGPSAGKKRKGGAWKAINSGDE